MAVKFGTDTQNPHGMNPNSFDDPFMFDVATSRSKMFNYPAKYLGIHRMDWQKMLQRHLLNRDVGDPLTFNLVPLA